MWKREEIVGSRIKVKVVKNKVAPPFKEAEFEIWYDRGIRNSVSIFETAIDDGTIEKAGNTYSFNGDKIGVGKNKALEYLEENQNILKSINDAVVNNEEKK